MWDSLEKTIIFLYGIISFPEQTCADSSSNRQDAGKTEELQWISGNNSQGTKWILREKASGFPQILFKNLIRKFLRIFQRPKTLLTGREVFSRDLVQWYNLCHRERNWGCIPTHRLDRVQWVQCKASQNRNKTKPQNASSVPEKHPYSAKNRTRNLVRKKLLKALVSFGVFLTTESYCIKAVPGCSTQFP